MVAFFMDPDSIRCNIGIRCPFSTQLFLFVVVFSSTFCSTVVLNSPTVAFIVLNLFLAHFWGSICNVVGKCHI
ncbi:hypothetical protein SLE2022_215310 [Rubroshorea leprosula]